MLLLNSSRHHPDSALPRSHERPSDISCVLVSTARIRRRVHELAHEISRDYATARPLLLIGVLRGAFIFLADLARELSVVHSVDFMAVSTYGRNTSVGEVRILMDLRESVRDRHLLIVEDIVDSGLTLAYLHRLLQTRHPASVRTCVMVRKQRRGLDVPVDYLGFEIPDVWVVGYGLDYADRHRTLPYIAECKVGTAVTSWSC